MAVQVKAPFHGHKKSSAKRRKARAKHQRVLQARRDGDMGRWTTLRAAALNPKEGEAERVSLTREKLSIEGAQKAAEAAGDGLLKRASARVLRFLGLRKKKKV